MRRTSLGIVSAAIALLALGACSGVPSAPPAPPGASAPTGPTAAGSSPTVAPPVATTAPAPAVSPVPVPTPHIKIQMTIDLAKKIAVQALGGGRVIEVKADDVHDVPVWQVTVETSDGRRHKV